MLLSQRLAMIVDQCAEAVGIFAKRSKEHMSSLSLDLVELRRGEHVVMAIHQSAFVIIIDIHVAVSGFEDIVAVLILPAGVILQRLDTLIDNLVQQFALVIKQPLYAIVLRGYQPLRPIDINRLVRSAQHRLEVEVIHYTLVTQTRVVQHTSITRLDLAIHRLKHPLTCSIQQSYMFVIGAQHQAVLVVQILVLPCSRKSLHVHLRTIAAKDVQRVLARHHAAVAGKLPRLVKRQRSEQLCRIQIDIRAPALLGEDGYRVTRRDMQPLDAVHQDLTRNRIIDMRTMLVAQTVATNLLAVQVLLYSLGRRMTAATE